MNLQEQTLEQLISPEILFEIQASFVKKHGVAICIYNTKQQPLLTFPRTLPTLEALSEEQKSLFDQFFDPNSIEHYFILPNHGQIQYSFFKKVSQHPDLPAI